MGGGGVGLHGADADVRYRLERRERGRGASTAALRVSLRAMPAETFRCAALGGA